MSESSESRRSFDDLTADLAAAGFRLDWMDEGPVRGEPMFAAFAHSDGRRIRFSHDLLTGQARLEDNGMILIVIILYSPRGLWYLVRLARPSAQPAG